MNFFFENLDRFSKKMSLYKIELDLFFVPSNTEIDYDYDNIVIDLKNTEVKLEKLKDSDNNKLKQKLLWKKNDLQKRRDFLEVFDFEEFLHLIDPMEFSSDFAMNLGEVIEAEWEGTKIIFTLKLDESSLDEEISFIAIDKEEYKNANTYEKLFDWLIDNPLEDWEYKEKTKNWVIYVPSSDEEYGFVDYRSSEKIKFKKL